jgi:bleomycin hydrolase
MKYIALTIITVFLFLNTNKLVSQTHDKGKFIDGKNEFWEEIKKTTDEYKKKPEIKKQKFVMDFSSYDLPKSISEFKVNWYSEPVCQAATNTCWCFCGTSFLESEMYRLNKKKIKMSEMFTVYWEYVEKAKRYIQERGKSAFGEGSQSNAVVKIWKEYGCVPEDVYEGKKKEQKFHDHFDMHPELHKYLKSIKDNNAWNEEEVIATVKSILNHWIGTPPAEFEYEGKKMTPMEFQKQVTKLDMDDYVDFMSLIEKPFWQQAEYEVEDNWWKCDKYYNVPLDDFMKIIKYAVKNGYTMAIGGDVSEPGMESHAKVAMIPTFDIPSEYIDDYARQFRFSNNTTTDDHGIHLVGYKEDKNGKIWFLIKDSGSGSRNVGDKGYYFMHEDYVKLKMMNFTIHRSAAEDILKKFKK